MSKEILVIPVHSADAEKSILAAVMASKEAMNTAYMELDTKDFYVPDHRHIWNGCAAIRGRGESFDLVVLGEELKRLGTLDAVGGIPALAEVMASYVSSAMLMEHIRIVKTASMRRRVTEAAVRLHQAATDPMCPLETLEDLGREVADATHVPDATDDAHDTNDTDDTVPPNMIRTIQDDTPVSSLGRANYGTITKKVENFFRSMCGLSATTKDAYEAVGARHEREKVVVRNAISRLLARGLLLREEKKNSSYTYRDDNYGEVSILGGPGGKREFFPLSMPLGLTELVGVYPKNLVVIAGQSSAGKTAFLLNIAAMNSGHPAGKPAYLMAEMAEEELQGRGEDMDPEFRDTLARSTSFIPCEDHFEHFIKLKNQNGLTICDYLKADGDNFLYVSKWLDDIHLSLDKGVAVVAIQKLAGKSHGVGGGHTESKPRLYITLDKFETVQGTLYTARLVKAKFPKIKQNIDGMACLYDLVDGWQIRKVTKWGRYTEQQLKELAAEYFSSIDRDFPA